MERGEVRSILRNPVLAGLLRDIPGYMERVGSGIRLMLNETRGMGLPAPQFREIGEFVVTFRKAPSSLSQSRDVSPEEDKPRQLMLDVLPATSSSVDEIEALDLDKREVRAMQYVQDHGSITNREYRQLTGVSASTANRDLESLVGQKILIRIGGKRGTRYKLP
jgi:ATP-dependent DNA helicase RecG